MMGELGEELTVERLGRWGWEGSSCDTRDFGTNREQRLEDRKTKRGDRRAGTKRHRWENDRDTMQGQAWGQQIDTEVQEGMHSKTDRPKVVTGAKWVRTTNRHSLEVKHPRWQKTD